ncbi:hypothetical protein ACJJTC_000830 [Scirpophaga incertulas]
MLTVYKIILLLANWHQIDGRPAIATRRGRGHGLMLLYRPKDISNDCAFSRDLRYDLSFGMGMSDTITIVLRNIKEIDYECTIEIVTDDKIFLIIVLRFPNSMVINCAHNADAFVLLSQNKCLRICDYIYTETKSPYFIVAVKRSIKFRFLSNSSINTDMDANIYQVTATSARKKPISGCNMINESYCTINEDNYCFTSGVECDGIKNCGVSDWFDERKSECELSLERIGYIPVVAVAAAILCVVLAAGHVLVRYLPPLANSFFIFNANEDNRLCVDPIFDAPNSALNIEKPRHKSLISVPSSSSKDMFDEEHPDNNTIETKQSDDSDIKNISEQFGSLQETSKGNDE